MGRCASRVDGKCGVEFVSRPPYPACTADGFASCEKHRAAVQRQEAEGPIRVCPECGSINFGVKPPGVDLVLFTRGCNCAWAAEQTAQAARELGALVEGRSGQPN